MAINRSDATQRPHRGLTILAKIIIEEFDSRGVTQKCLVEFDVINNRINQRLNFVSISPGTIRQFLKEWAGKYKIMQDFNRLIEGLPFY